MKMKKRNIIIGVILLIIYIVFGIIISFVLLPYDWKSDAITVTSDGRVCVTYNGAHRVWILEMDDDDSADLEMCTIGGKDSESFITAIQNNIYVMVTWIEKQQQHIAIYGKLEESSGYRELANVCLGSDKDVEVTNFRAIGDKVITLGIEQTTRDIIELTYQDGNVVERVIKTSVPLIDINTGEDGLYGLDMQGRVYRYDEANIVRDTGLENVAYITPTSTGIFYQYIDDSVLYYESYDKTVHKHFNNLKDVRYVRMNANGDQMAIFQWDGTITSMDMSGNLTSDFGDVDVRIRTVLLQLVPIWVLYTICYIAVVIGLILLVHCIVLSKKMLIQVASFLAVTSIVWIVLMLQLVLQYDKITDENEAYAVLYTYAGLLSQEFEEKIEESGLRYDEAIYNQEFLEDVFDDKLIEMLGIGFIRKELIRDTGQDYKIVYSKEEVRDICIDRTYLREIAKNIPEKFENGCIVLGEEVINEKGYYGCIISFGNVGTKLYLITRMPKEGMNVTKAELMKHSYFLAGSWLVIALAFIVAFHHIWKPVKLVNLQLEKMAKGDYSISNHGILDNEVGDIWTSLDVLCKNLSFKDYKKNNTLESVLQYAPMHFEKLFGRNKLQEVLVGESTTIHTTVGIISVFDTKLMVEGKVQRSYLKYVNMLLNILVEQDKHEEVVLLQNDGNMEGVKMIFTGDVEDRNAGESVYYGITCMESILAKTQDIYEVNPFVFLHTAECTGGIAGGSGHAYPFITCADIDILNTYVDRLRKCDIAMVVTAPTHTLLNGKYNTRYIGYVIGADNETQLKLYEVLDACTEKMRKEKLAHDNLFQQGIALYYQHEYFKARGCFIEYLKLCQEDGLAAWYLFACENGLTEMNKQEDLSLFGVM